MLGDAVEQRAGEAATEALKSLGLSLEPRDSVN